MKTLFLGDIAPYKNGAELFKTKDLSKIFGDVLPITEGRDFGHMLDCEAHTDVWRELFPSWNLTNCLDEE